MNIQEYIESGILESYLLGATTVGESIEVERLAAEYPAIQVELMALQGTLENYALQYEQEPPAALKGRIMEALAQEKNNHTAQFSDLKALIEPVQPYIENDNIRPINTLQTPQFAMNWRVAASWVLLALSIAGNVWFFNNWKQSEEKVLALETQNQVLAQEGQMLKASYQEEVALLQNPNTRVIKLMGQPVNPTATAMIYFNQSSKEVYLSALNLPVAPAGKQYQLWAIIDNKPVDAGLIEGNSSFAKMKSLGNVQTFAISLEKTGGSTTQAGPKGDIYVAGNV